MTSKTGKRPLVARCRKSCDRRRHAAYRRLMNALRELREAGTAVLALPEPDDDCEAMDAAGIAVDVRGALWVVSVMEMAVESSVKECCLADGD